jgi:hypothetical protein
MNWSDCESAWKRQPVAPASPAEIRSLESGFETKRRQMASARLLRSVIEVSMGPIVCIGIAGMWWFTGRGGWPTIAAILLIHGGFGAFWFACRRSRAQEASADAPLLVKVDSDIARLQRERRRLLTMRSSVYGTVIAAALLIPFVLWLAHDRSRDSFAVAFSIYYSATLVIGWLLNRREVRTRIDPRLDELEKLRQALAA